MSYVKGRVKRCHSCGWELTAHYSAQLGPLRVQHQVMTAHLEKLQAWAHHTWTEQQEQKAKAAALGAQLQQAEAERQQAQSQLTSLQQERERLAAQLANLEPVSPAAALPAATPATETTPSALDWLLARFARAEEERLQLRHQVAQLQVALEQLQAAPPPLAESNGSSPLVLEVQELRVQLSNQIQVTDELYRQVAQMRQQAQQVQAERDQLQQLSGQVQQLQVQGDRHGRQLHQTEAQLSQLQTQQTAREPQWEQLHYLAIASSEWSAQLRRQQEQQQQAAAERSQLQATLSSQQTRLQQMETERQQLRLKLERSEASLGDRIRAVESSLDTLKQSLKVASRIHTVSPARATPPVYTRYRQSRAPLAPSARRGLEQRNQRGTVAPRNRVESVPDRVLVRAQGRWLAASRCLHESKSDYALVSLAASASHPRATRVLG